MSSDPSGPGGSGGALECGSGEVIVGPTPLRRMTRLQYQNTVRDLLGVSDVGALDLPVDDRTEGFEVGSTVSPLHVERYADAAERLSAAATENLDGLLPCDPAESGEDACADSFIRDFGRRAFRRPLAADEHARFRQIFGAGRDAVDFRTGIELVIQAALQSPKFLYHVEANVADVAPGVVERLDAFSLANRLAYFFWNTMPDESLLEAAESGALETEEGLEAQVRRLLDDPRAEGGMRNFFRQWLELDRLDGIEKNPELHPDFDAETARTLRRSLEAFLDSVLDEGGSLDDLLLASHAFVSSEIAPLFGLDVEGQELVRVDLDPSQRAGILSHPALLALHAKPNQSDPIHRGTFVREHLFCQHLPPPPADLVVVAPDPAPGLSTRERFAEHSSNVACKGCHELVDPIGFGFEHYDELGRWRDEDDGRAVDASGEIVSTRDANGPFYGVPELAERLADSRDVAECVVRQMFRFALQRVEANADRCTITSIDAHFASSGKSLRDLLVHIAKSDAFRYRIAPDLEGEVQ